MQYKDGPNLSLEAGAALAQYRLVKPDTGVLQYADDNDTNVLGATMQAALAAGDIVPVRSRLCAGTMILTASEAISQYAACYQAANGKVASSGTVLVGLALQASTADGDLIEVLPSAAAILGSVARAVLTQDDLAPYALPLVNAKVWDAPQTAIPGTPANDDLGLIYNTLGTASPSIESGDAKAATVTRYTYLQWAVPKEYQAGQTITLRLNAGMKTTVSDTSATIDAQVYRQAAPTVDICATAAQSINSLTAADKDFTITPTDVVPGDLLEIRLAIAIVDGATGTAVIGKLYRATVLADIKG